MAEVIRMNENTWRIEDGMVRFFLLCGSERALMIDSGVSGTDARAAAESLTDLPVELLNTHTDRDHIAGNASFDKVYMDPAEEPHYRAQGMTEEIIPLKEGDVIDLGGRPLRIVALPGHTPGSIAVLDENSRVLISGDPVQDGNIYMFTERRDMGRYIESLRHLLYFTEQFDEIWSSHGTVPVYPEIIPKLISAAESIMDGSASGKEVVLHGMTVMLYSFPFAGFYCDTPV